MADQPQPANKWLREEQIQPLANPWLIGCDPEFVALNEDGMIVNAVRRLPKDGPLGYDHGGRVLELRPPPSRSVYMLVRNLATILREQPSPLEAKRYRAGAYWRTPDGDPVTLGGHIHFDIPVRVRDAREFETLGAQLDALDRVTKYLESIDILPKGEAEQRRRDPQARAQRYGMWGDFRVAGVNNRLEYRAMSSWLYHPLTAYVSLTLAKLAVLEPRSVKELENGAPATLNKFLELWRASDFDAARVYERVLERGLSLQRDPDADVYTTWRALPL